MSNAESKPMKILSADSYLYDMDYDVFDIKIILINSSDKSIISQVTVAGASDYPSFKVAIKATVHDKYTRIYFHFEYKGVRYKASINSYNVNFYDFLSLCIMKMDCKREKSL